MYKKTAGQLRMEDAVFLHKSIKLSRSNRWVQIAHLIPWEKYEDQYGSLFASNKGGPYAHSIRTGLGALLIKTKLNLSDAETVLMIFRKSGDAISGRR